MSNISKQQIHDSFLSESAELLEELENNVIALENDPSDRNTIDNIFRALHSLKGNSSLLGLSDIKLFVHQMENLADKVRNREIDVTTSVINLMLEAKDHVKSMFSRLNRDLDNVPLLVEEEEFHEKVLEMIDPQGQGAAGSDLRTEFLKFFSDPEIQTELQTNEPLKKIVEIIGNVSPNLLEDRRNENAIQLTMLYDGVDVTREIASIKSIIDEVDRGITSETHISIIFKNLDELILKHEEKLHDEPMQIFNELREELEMFYHDESGFDDVLAQITGDALKKYMENVVIVEPEKEKELEEGEPAQPQKSGRDKKAKPDKLQATQTVKQIKVDQEKLDNAIDIAGELVTISEFFNFINAQVTANRGDLSSQLNNFRDSTMALQELSEQISKKLYDIRKVPVEEALKNLPRIIRDEQQALGKKARLYIEGEDILIDKSLVQKLENVLVHMIRNSMDHAIECPEERVKRSKPEEGSISIIINSDGTMMTIRVEDDGKGIDLDKIKGKIVERGLADEAAANSLSDSQIAEYIFSAGFSTAEKITETSGRGVGMDIVSSTMAEMNGGVSVTTKKGEGSSIVLKFPLSQTTIVKKGLAIAVGQSIFLLPIEMVLESFRPAKGEISTVEGRAEVVNRRGEIIPLIRLNALFNINAKKDDPHDAIIILVQYKSQKICVMVDEVVGQRQIIYKDLLVKTLKQPSPFEGVSVYDGSRLAMILDVKGIMEQARK